MALTNLFMPLGFPEAPEHVDVVVLGAAANETYTVPDGAEFVVFSASGNFYAKRAGAAAVPTSDVSDGSGSQLNPSAWRVKGVSTIGLIASDAVTVTLAVYRRASHFIPKG